MKLTNFSNGTEAKNFPVEIATDLNMFESYPSQDFSAIQQQQQQPQQFPSQSFNYLTDGYIEGGKKKPKEKSWLDYLLNPFECETDYDDEDYVDM